MDGLLESNKTQTYDERYAVVWMCGCGRRIEDARMARYLFSCGMVT